METLELDGIVESLEEAMAALQQEFLDVIDDASAYENDIVDVCSVLIASQEESVAALRGASEAGISHLHQFIGKVRHIDAALEGTPERMMSQIHRLSTQVGRLEVAVAAAISANKVKSN